MDKLFLLNSCITINLLILALFLSSFFIFEHYNSSYFNVGWSNKFIFISIPINTPVKYFTFCTYIITMNVSEIFMDNIATPLIQFSTYNPYKSQIYDFTRCELETYSNVIYFIGATKRLIQVFVVLSQIDIAIISLVSSQLSAFLAIKYLLQHKTFVGETSRNYYADLGTHFYQNSEFMPIRPQPRHYENIDSPTRPSQYHI